MRSKNSEILASVFLARIEAVESLQAELSTGPAGGSERVRAQAKQLEQAGQTYNAAAGAHPYEMLSSFMYIAAWLLDWRDGVRTAVPDADRFLRAAREHWRTWRDSQGERLLPAALLELGATVDAINTTSDVTNFIEALAAIRLPVATHVHASPRRLFMPSGGAQKEESAPEELAVAFLKFTINGTPASDTHYLEPNEVHDLDIEVRVSRWPDKAEILELRPISAEPAAIYDLPVFRFSPPEGAAPYTFRDKGRAVLRAAQSLHARPFEFKYAAEFKPAAGRERVYVEGHRTLRLEAIDWRTRSLSGYPGVDRAIIAIRDQLRQTPGLLADDVTNAVRLLSALGNLAGQAVQEAWFSAGTKEAQFQQNVRRWLRARPDIGSELEEHPKAAGGVTDLVFHGIPIELKAEPDSEVSFETCKKHLPQAASYAVGNGKRLAFLCMLSSAAKTTAAYPAEDGFKILSFMPVDANASSSIAIPTIIIQGGLARPSSLKGS